MSSSIAARRLRRVDLVQAQLALEDVERPICLLAGRLAEMRGTVHEQARPVERLADAAVTIEVGLGHGPNTTRRATDWEDALADALARAGGRFRSTSASCPAAATG